MQEEEEEKEENQRKEVFDRILCYSFNILSAKEYIK